MKRKGMIFLLLLLVAMLMVAGAMAEEATPSDTVPEHDYHYAMCDEPGVCALYGEPYDGDNIQHTGGSTFISDEEYHYEVCAGCDEVIGQNGHSSECTNPGVCSGCGSPYDGDNVWHIGRIKTSDETYHYNICESCGEVLWQGEHYESCIEPGVCEYCGAKGNMAWTEHDGEYTYDENLHYFTCHDCGEVEGSEHYTWCDEDPNTCLSCGYHGEIRTVYHYSNGEYEYDEKYHYEICEVCGERGWQSTHYAYCESPKECRSCGYVSEGEDIADILHNDWQYEADGNGHWESCGACGKLFSKSTHYARCDQPGVCAACGYEDSDMSISHYWSGKYEVDETNHYEYCPVCGELSWSGWHYADCTKPGVCSTCGVKYDGDNKGHTWSSVWEHDGDKHWMMCANCDDYVVEPTEHWEYCFAPDGLCDNCGEPFEGEVSHSGAYGTTVEHDGTYHWYDCFYCGETIKEKHYTASWGKKGICSFCDTKFGATSSSSSNTSSSTGTAAEETEDEETLADVIGEEGEDFLSRFMDNSADAAAGDLLSGEQDVTLTIAAGDEANYEGSVLNVYRSGSREDGVTIALESKYDADTLTNFKAWQAAITSVAELQASESFKSFTELAEALVQALLPGKTADEVDAIIVALLQSGENLGDLDVDLGDDIDGEIVGYLAQDGYEFILVLRDGSVELLVREAA